MAKISGNYVRHGGDLKFCGLDSNQNRSNEALTLRMRMTKKKYL